MRAFHDISKRFQVNYHQNSNISHTLVGNQLLITQMKCSNYIFFILDLTPGFNGFWFWTKKKPTPFSTEIADFEVQ